MEATSVDTKFQVPEDLPSDAPARDDVIGGARSGRVQALNPAITAADQPERSTSGSPLPSSRSLSIPGRLGKPRLQGFGFRLPDHEGLVFLVSPRGQEGNENFPGKIKYACSCMHKFPLAGLNLVFNALWAITRPIEPRQISQRQEPGQVLGDGYRVPCVTTEYLPG